MLKNILTIIITFILCSCSTYNLQTTKSYSIPLKKHANIYYADKNITSETEYRFTKRIHSLLSSKGYTLVDSPKNSDYLLEIELRDQVDHLKMNTCQPKTAITTGRVGGSSVYLNTNSCESITRSITAVTTLGNIYIKTQNSKNDLVWFGSLGTNPKSFKENPEKKADILLENLGKTTTEQKMN